MGIDKFFINAIEIHIVKFTSDDGYEYKTYFLSNDQYVKATNEFIKHSINGNAKFELLFRAWITQHTIEENYVKTFDDIDLSHDDEAF